MRTRLWVRFRFCWARRRANDNLPAPSLPSTQNANSNNSQANTGPMELADVSSSPEQERPRYPFLEVWTSAEEAAAQIARRKDARGVWPEPDVQRAWERKQLQQLTA